MAITTGEPESEYDASALTVTIITESGSMRLSETGVEGGKQVFEGEAADPYGYVLGTVQVRTTVSTTSAEIIQATPLADGGTLYLITDSTGVTNEVYAWAYEQSVVCVLKLGDTGEVAQYTWTNVNSTLSSSDSAVARVAVMTATRTDIPQWTMSGIWIQASDCTSSCKTACEDQAGGVDAQGKPNDPQYDYIWAHADYEENPESCKCECRFYGH